MNKPEKRKLDKNSAYLQYDKGYNHSYDEWVKYIKSIGGVVECALLHDESCECQNDE